VIPIAPVPVIPITPWCNCHGVIGTMAVKNSV